MIFVIFIEKNEIIPFAATWMDLEIIILNEVSHTEKDKYLTTSIQHSFGSPRHSNQTRNKMYPNWNIRDKTVIIHR